MIDFVVNFQKKRIYDKQSKMKPNLIKELIQIHLVLKRKSIEFYFPEVLKTCPNKYALFALTSMVWKVCPGSENSTIPGSLKPNIMLFFDLV